MATQEYKWNRWWVPHGSEIRAFGGFVLDRGDETGLLGNPEAVHLDAFSDNLCCVLLGDAGLGKSSEVQKLRDHLQRSEPNVLATQYLDLGNYGDEERLKQDLLTDWESFATGTVQGNHYVVLDSLDESSIAPSRILHTIGSVISGKPIDRLRLRIACRTTAWTDSFTNTLQQLLGEDRVKVLELVPLSESDVRLAAKSEGLTESAFLAAINRMDVATLAANPTTLRFLIGLFRRDGALPSSAVELYRQGLELLCEQTPSRRERRVASELTAPQLFNVASRVAGFMVLTARPQLFHGSAVDAHDGDVCLAELVGGYQGEGPRRVELTGRSIEEVLTQTGLMTSRGQGRFAFVHKTYAEFLAAQFVNNCKMPLRQVESLFFDQGEHPRMLRPQLLEAAAWLASLSPEFAERVMDTEPATLLLSDVAIRDGELKQQLTSALLDFVSERRLTHAKTWDLHGYLHRLDHGKLTEQIRPWIRDESRHYLAREMAISIAGECKTVGVVDDLVEIALCPKGDLQFRVAAARAVVEIGVPSGKQRLKPLAIGEDGVETCEELRGIGLMATWPNFLSLEELLNAISRAPSISSYNSYHAFLRQLDLDVTLRTGEFPFFFESAARLPHHNGYSDIRRDITDRVVYRAWKEIDAAGVAESLALFTLRRFRMHDCLQMIDDDERPQRHSQGRPNSQSIIESDQRRRRVLLTGLSKHIEKKTDALMLTWGEASLLYTSDFEWLVEQALASIAQQARAFALMAFAVFRWEDPVHLDRWLTVRDQLSILNDDFALPLKCDLGSAEADQAIKEYEERRRRTARLTRRRKGRLPLVEQIRTAIDSCMESDPWQFGQLVLVLMLHDPDSDFQIPFQIKDTPGWKAADTFLRSEIMAAARRFLKDANLQPQTLAIESRRVPDLVPGLAVQLLLEEDRGFFAGLDDARIDLVIPYILIGQPLGLIGDEPCLVDLAHLLFERRPDVTNSAVQRVLEHQLMADPHLSVLRMLQHYRDSKFADLVVQTIEMRDLVPDALGAALRWLFQRNPTVAYRIGASQLDPLPSVGTSARDRSVRAAIVLIQHRRAEAWPAVWSAISRDGDWGEAFVRGIAGLDSAFLSSWIESITDVELGVLGQWLFSRFPGHSNHHDDVRLLRDRALNILVTRGTAEASEALRALRDAHPRNEWLQDLWLDSESARRRSNWHPPTPTEFRKMVEDGNRRLVVSEADLLDVVVESLNRLSQQLQGTTPAVADLWNEIAKDVCRPKDENHLSDYVVRHLRSDLKARGIVANREVEIRRRTSKDGQPGQDTDIFVEAFNNHHANSHHDFLRIIIEVKGCWHNEVRHAMKSQLVDRYLHENQTRFGLYLVGWYVCAAWDNKDYRRKRTPWKSISDCRSELEKQAAGLTEGAMRGKGEVRAYVLDAALR